MDFWDSKKQETIAITVFLLIVFVFPFFLFIFGNTALQFITVIVGICILVLMLVLHNRNVKEDKSRGICKGKNGVWSVRVSGALLCLVGIYSIYTGWERLSISDPFDWIWVILAAFFIIRGGICFRAASEYSRTIERVEEFEGELQRLGFEIDELGRPRRKNGEDVGSSFEV